MADPGEAQDGKYESSLHRAVVPLFCAWFVALGLLCVILLLAGLDRATDAFVNFLFGELVQDGHRRLAGISAPLSEESVKLVAGIIGFASLARISGTSNKGLAQLASPLGILLAAAGIGAGFAIFETTMNGDAQGLAFGFAVAQRFLAHTSYTLLALTGFSIFRGGRHLSGSILILTAYVVHGLKNWFRPETPYSLGVLLLGLSALLAMGLWYKAAVSNRLDQWPAGGFEKLAV